MTAQIADKIFIKGKQYPLFTNPLDDYWTKKNPKPKVRMTTTACWRGYEASWEISDNCLYLIDIIIYIYLGDVGLDYLFPRNAGKVKAVWFSGELKIPLGDMLQYVHGGYESTFDSDWFIKIKKGNLISERYKANY